MPSFISSSDYARIRAPRLKWGMVWIASAALSAGMLSGLEWFWREQGHSPSVVDSPALWSHHMSRAAKFDKDALILVGTSRLQVGFDTETFRTMYPNRKISQLAVQGRFPIATLRHLAEQDDFSGTILCETHEVGFCHRLWDGQKDYLDPYSSFFLQQRLECVARTFLQARLVILNPSVRLIRTAESWLRKGKLPSPGSLVTQADRSALADYSSVDLSIDRQNVITLAEHADTRNVSTPSQWMRDFAEVEELVSRVQKRGGRVVFVRFPTSGKYYALDEQRFPKIAYWDRMAEYTSAAAIHFKDVPELARFTCPDTSHLDRRDAPLFTRELLKELARLKIL